MNAAIHIENLFKSYQEVEALSDVSLAVTPGELFGLIGPDGAGKTTLFRILTTLIFPDKGHVEVLGLDPINDFKLLRKKIGYMPGRFSLYQDLTVEENLKLFASIFETTVEKNYDLIKDIYQQIEPFKHRKAGKLSGGMKQKLALSCAMIHRPEILFLDEPTTGVDPVSRREFWDMLDNLHKEGITIMVSTPYMDEAKRCGKIGLIQDGELLGTDTPTQIVRQYKTPLFSIKGSNIYHLLTTLKNHPQGHSAYSFGSEIHFATKSLDQTSIKEFLVSQGFEDFSIVPIEANIEDTFMELMTHA